jgi:hypothetical protein
MDHDLVFTEPVFVPEDGIFFSAYGLGRGYCAFTLTYDAVCQKLGAGDCDSEEVLLAFELNQPRIARAIDTKHLPRDGRRVTLDARDFV